MSRRLCSAILAAALIFFASHSDAAKTQVNLATGPPGAASNIMGAVFATFVNKHVEGVSMNVPGSKGFIFNIRAVESGRFEFMLQASSLMSRAVAGKRPYKKKYKRARGMFPLTTAAYQVIVLPSSGVTSIEGLRGKRINIAPKGSITNAIARGILSAAGIWKDFSREHLDYTAAATALTDNRITGFIQPAPIPTQTIMMIARVSGGLRVLPVEGAVAKRAMKSMPGTFPIKIPAGLYKGVDKDVMTIGHSAFYAARDSVSAEMVYKIVKAVYSAAGRKKLPQGHPAYRNVYKLSPGWQIFRAARIKLHPGSVRYWKEKGVEVPADLRP